MNEIKHIKPDILFEISWEVCNKVGGIYTVLSSKYESVKKNFSGQHIFIGPDVWKETHENPDFIEDKSLHRLWIDKAEKEGLRFRIGHWNIPGNPVAVLVDFTPLFSEKDKVFASLWETYRLDSLTGGWDYIEPALFGYAAGKVIESFYDFYLTPSDKIVANFHEWMTAAGILYLKKEAPGVGTVFTTHATTLGRSMAGNHLPLYSQLESIEPIETAKKLNVLSKYSLESNAAHHADSFTTVSDITAEECNYLLKKKVDVVTPNGFSGSFAPDVKDIKKKKKESRAKIAKVVEAVLNQKIDDDALIILTSGRYEFFNKGMDAFIDALAILNQNKTLNRQVVGIIAVPGNHAGPRTEVFNRLKNPDFNNPLSNEYVTHNLWDKYNDPVIKRILEKNLNNGAGSKVKILFVPVYMNGTDGIFNMHYYDFLNGFDLTAFPSFYEPWGYTPLESIAFHIPTITTSLAGFGTWVNREYKTPFSSVVVIERTENNYDAFINELARQIRNYLELKKEVFANACKEAFEISKYMHWDKLSSKYWEAYTIALNKAEERSGQVSRKPSIEYIISESKTEETPSWKKFFVRTQVPKELEPLKEISMNLWWCWNYKAEELFISINKDLWEETGHSPVALINRLSFEKMQQLKNDTGFMETLTLVFNDFKAYMAEKKNRPKEKIGYFSMEYGLHESVKIYSGGLGILAGDYLKEASDSNVHLVAIGLMYRYGYFAQNISIFGDQIAESLPQKYTDLPLRPVYKEDGSWVTVELALPGRNLHAKVWKLEVGRIDLYLLDTDIELNTLEDRAITHHLYGGDWDNRFKQELLLGVGGVRLLYELDIRPDIYHLNEGHAAFAGLERLRHLVEKYGMTFSASKEIIRGTSLFTTHTPVPAGHDKFTEDRLRTYIPHYPERLNISWEKFMDLGKIHPGNQNERFSMSVLAANLSQEMNGVSKIHGRVSREMFQDLYKGYFPNELHIGHVTNGVHYATWTSSIFQNFYTAEFGESFVKNQTDPENWKKIYNVSDNSLWQERVKAKNEFVEFVREKYSRDLLRRQENPRYIYQSLEGLVEDALYIGFARRFATYKRAHLLFTNLEKLEAITSNEKMPVRFVFAGKAHPNDKPGQDLIKRVVEISHMPQFIGKIIFLENYDMAVARKLVSGVDIWLNTPTRPLEASGTSGEKAVMNGVLNFSVLDGWWAEGYKKNAGWAIAEAKTYGNQAFQDEMDAEIIYRYFEDEIMPLYFNKDEQGVSKAWVGFIKNNLAGIAPHFTMKRMMDDYFKQFYAKLFARSKMIRNNKYEMAYTIEAWKNEIISKWEHIDIKAVRLPNITMSPINLGEDFNVDVDIFTNGIKPQDIGIEIVLGQKEMDRVKHVHHVQELKLIDTKDTISKYSCLLNLADSGVFDFAFRIFPKSDFLPHRQDFCLVKWV
ncbi:MAG: alpha-glucan family phosphorylase [Bacteroidales bacterium]